MRSLVQSESDGGMWSARTYSDSKDESDDDPRCQVLTFAKEESFRQRLGKANAVSIHPEGALAPVDELITTQSLVQSADASDYDPQSRAMMATMLACIAIIAAAHAVQRRASDVPAMTMAESRERSSKRD